MDKKNKKTKEPPKEEAKKEYVNYVATLLKKYPHNLK